MRKAVVSVGQVVGSLAILAAALLGAAIGLRSLLRYLFEDVSPTVAAAIVAAVTTGSLSVVTLVLQRRHERRQAVEHEIHDRKVDVYTELLGQFFEIFGLGEDRTDEESERIIQGVLRNLGKLTPALIAWAPDSVLLAWSRYRRTLGGAGDNPIGAMFGFEDVLLAIRLDLGHDNKGITKGDLLALWVNDIDDHLAQTPAN